ncbi:MAG: hypothetical protein AAF443_06595 [Chlamydiota bacterium]
MYVKCFFLFITVLFATELFSAAVTIFNDSPFPLKAEIVAADGTKKGSVQVTPQQTVTWQDPETGYAVWSQTPYTVIFTCRDGKQFGIYTDVSPGATITALTSSGDRYCQPEKKKETEPSPFPPPQTNPGELYIDPNLGPP